MSLSIHVVKCRGINLMSKKLTSVSFFKRVKFAERTGMSENCKMEEGLKSFGNSVSLDA